MARQAAPGQPASPGSISQPQAQPFQAAEHSHPSESGKPLHSRAWLAEGVRLASWAHRWARAGDSPRGLMLALQGMLGTLFHMSVFVSFREHHLVTCALNVLQALLYCQFASTAWLQPAPGSAASAAAGAATSMAALGCPRALLPAALGHGPRCVALCALMYQLPLSWALFQLAAVTATFLWHTPAFCEHHAACGQLACQASYALMLVAVSALMAAALYFSAKKHPTRL